MHPTQFDQRYGMSGLAEISETQSLPEAGITGTGGTTYDPDGNPASLTHPDGKARCIACQPPRP